MPGLLSCIVRGERQREGAGMGVEGPGVMDKRCRWVLDPADLPGGQATHVPLLLPDSEDRENLLRNGVTHILSVHSGAKPVLEVSARVGDLGDHPEGAGAGKVRVGHMLFSRREEEKGEAMAGLHRFAAVYTTQC